MTHQTILVYSRSVAAGGGFTWNGGDPALREPYAATSLSMHFTNRDADGRLYRERVVKGKAYRYYADEGRRLGSVWTDCPSMSANSPLRDEATGWPTQKPEKLLERIVRLASCEGDLVADLMCGSGAMLRVAERTGRAWIGGDLDTSVARETVARAAR
jgi:site-specific DNA-methyltransferase (adenine-specific)